MFAGARTRPIGRARVESLGFRLKGAIMENFRSWAWLGRLFAAGSETGVKTAGPGRAGGVPPVNRLRVMVADDNPANHLEAIELLSVWGITPVLAADGAEAVALAGGQDFDLILMDMNMPVLDGLSATRQIRCEEAQNARARAPVVAYTSSAFSDFDPDLPNELLRSRGVDGMLVKPCDAGAMRVCLARWCPQGIEPDAAPGSP